MELVPDFRLMELSGFGRSKKVALDQRLYGELIRIDYYDSLAV